MSKQSDKAQAIRNAARKKYDDTLRENDRILNEADEKAYQVYCDTLDVAAKIEGNPKTKR